MKLRDIFTEAFWKARLKDTMDGFAAYGRAVTGQPPYDPSQPLPGDQPATEKKPEPPAAPKL